MFIVTPFTMYSVHLYYIAHAYPDQKKNISLEYLLKMAQFLFKIKILSDFEVSQRLGS